MVFYGILCSVSHDISVRYAKVNPEAKPPPAKPRFSRLDVENAA